MDEALFAQVQRIAADVLGVAADEITADASPDSIESWDSVNHLNLVMALEQELGVSFSPDDIAKMTSVGAIMGAVEAGQG